MANAIQGSGQNVVIINGFKYTADLTTNLVPAGSASSADTQIIQTGSWQSVYTSNVVTDVGSIYLDNPNGPGTVMFSGSLSGTQSFFVTTAPTKWNWLSWSGSVNIYAKAIDTASVIAYVVAPN